MCEDTAYLSELCVGWDFSLVLYTVCLAHPVAAGMTPVVSCSGIMTQNRDQYRGDRVTKGFGYIYITMDCISLAQSVYTGSVVLQYRSGCHVAKTSLQSGSKQNFVGRNHISTTVQFVIPYHFM